MDFVIEFLWYLLAFVLGAGVAWILAIIFVKPQSEDEAFADLEDARTAGGRL